jgi:hypothetical protein
MDGNPTSKFQTKSHGNPSFAKSLIGFFVTPLKDTLVMTTLKEMVLSSAELLAA